VLFWTDDGAVRTTLRTLPFNVGIQDLRSFPDPERRGRVRCRA
jgi:hypothetical protein